MDEKGGRSGTHSSGTRCQFRIAIYRPKCVQRASPHAQRPITRMQQPEWQPPPPFPTRREIPPVPRRWIVSVERLSPSRAALAQRIPSQECYSHHLRAGPTLPTPASGVGASPTRKGKEEDQIPHRPSRVAELWHLITSGVDCVSFGVRRRAYVRTRQANVSRRNRPKMDHKDRPADKCHG